MLQLNGPLALWLFYFPHPALRAGLGNLQDLRHCDRSQASSARSFARANDFATQLPSPGTLPIGAIIWYTELL